MNRNLNIPVRSLRRLRLKRLWQYSGVLMLALLWMLPRVSCAEDIPVPPPVVPLLQQPMAEPPQRLPSSADSADETADLQAQKQARIKELERQIREVNERLAGLKSQRSTTAEKATRETSTVPIMVPEIPETLGNLVVPEPTPIRVNPPDPGRPVAPADIRTDPAVERPDDSPAASNSPKVEPREAGKPETTAQNSTPDRVLIPLLPGIPPATFPPRLPQGEGVPAAVSPAVIDPETTLTGAVDRMALANSLFATGQFQQCLQTLDAVLDSTLSTDEREWKIYLRACCHRSLNNQQEAIRIYRNIVGGPESAWTRDLAMWWLDHLNERDQLIKGTQELRAVLTEFEKEGNQNAKPAN